MNDTTHDVYVVDGGDNRVEEFTSAGVYIGQFNGSAAPTGAFDEPTTIAVDNSGSLLDSVRRGCVCGRQRSQRDRQVQRRGCL